MPTQVERRTATQLAIVNSAAFAYQQERSIDVALESIAAGAGVTKGSILYHFKSRLGLLTEVAQSIFLELVSGLGVETESDPQAWSRALLVALATPAGFVLYAIGDELTCAGKLAETDPYPYLQRFLVSRGVTESADITAAALTFLGRRLALGLETPDAIDPFVARLCRHGLFV